MWNTKLTRLKSSQVALCIKLEGLTLHIPVDRLLNICIKDGRGLGDQDHQNPGMSWNTVTVSLLDLSPIRRPLLRGDLK